MKKTVKTCIVSIDSEMHQLVASKIEKVVFNDPSTIVKWDDGTETVVSTHNDYFNQEAGLAMAIAKKAVGAGAFKKALQGAIVAKRKEPKTTAERFQDALYGALMVCVAAGNELTKGDIMAIMSHLGVAASESANSQIYALSLTGGAAERKPVEHSKR